MKPKELPGILFKALQLKLTSLETLQGANKQGLPVQVSLTSIPSRIDKLHYTIRSLMLQNCLPQRIVLWLHHELKAKIPRQLAILEGDLFSIRYSEFTCSHRKLVHTLEEFPDSIIVTCDDDVIYPVDWLEMLYQEHLVYPDQVIANRCNMIAYDSEGNTLPYRQWIKNVTPGTSSMAIMPAGYGGVLYPPGALLAETTDSKLYLKLAPKADDLWFKAMSFLNGTLCRRAEHVSQKPTPVLGTQSLTLGASNIKLDKNREQWDALRAHYQFKTPDPELPGGNIKPSTGK
ncbi:hypothetical protein SAMN02745866_00860 [Alteromonadaceae bacterium Bs31]|nr:hypothetical protein SAMN02745866_00860 [Alteromonadaceae bacterium Bs31]